MKHNFVYDEPMRYFTYVEPTSATDNTPIFVTMSEREIVENYFDYWLDKMKSIGYHEKDLSYKDCIDDWCVIHWAVESTP